MPGAGPPGGGRSRAAARAWTRESLDHDQGRALGGSGQRAAPERRRSSETVGRGPWPAGGLPSYTGCRPTRLRRTRIRFGSRGPELGPDSGPRAGSPESCDGPLGPGLSILATRACARSGTDSETEAAPGPGELLTRLLLWAAAGAAGLLL